ncbi:PucR family transcriptional regulator [Desulfitibacter alkalitolerans]|uniref:PucR family transcriptional regulator n=1 Tax=Desulfitibacter alkalitolerans TaxID=264641 RepID=UPI0006876D28|nr:helix-turn-helix domain-containing protein [Desulfitibacter alkalitolerans]
MDNFPLKNHATLQELLALEPLLSCKVISGWSGRANSVYGIFELFLPINPTPEDPRDSLIIINSNHKEVSQKDLLLDLSQLLTDGIAGVVFAGGIAEKLPQEILDLSDSQEVPIITTANEITVEAVQSKVELIQLLKESNEFLSLAETSIFPLFLGLEKEKIAVRLQEKIGKSVLLLNSVYKLQCLSYHRKNSSLDDKLLAAVTRIIQGESQGLSKHLKNTGSNGFKVKINHGKNTLKDGLDFYYIYLPLTANNQLYGYLAAFDWEDFNELDIAQVKQASLVVLQQLINEKKCSYIQAKYMSSFIYDLLYNNYQSREDLTEKAKLWNFSLDLSYQLFLLEEEVGSENNTELISLLQSVINTSVNIPLQKSFISELHGQIIILIPANTADTSRESKNTAVDLARIFLKEIKRTKRSVKIGMGRVYEAVDLCRSYQESKLALELGKYVKDGGQITHFDDLGFIRLIANVSYELLDDYSKEYLDKIVEHDEKNNTNLMQTLDVYFQQNGDLNKTAEKLFLHPNSLRYRLKKIEEVTEINLQEYGDIFNLFLAIKISKMRRHGFGILS